MKLSGLISSLDGWDNDVVRDVLVDMLLLAKRYEALTRFDGVANRVKNCNELYKDFIHLLHYEVLNNGGDGYLVDKALEAVDDGDCLGWLLLSMQDGIRCFFKNIEGFNALNKEDFEAIFNGVMKVIEYLSGKMILDNA